MERDTDTNDLVDLGTASIETRGAPVGDKQEPIGFYPLGLSAE
jgi:hypothetical protein